MAREPEPIQPWISAFSAHGSPSWTAGSVGSTTASHIIEDAHSENSRVPITSNPLLQRNPAAHKSDSNGNGNLTSRSQNGPGGDVNQSFHRLLYWLVLGPEDRLGDAELGPDMDRSKIKNYQMFTGRSMFLFGGRMISSTGKPLSITVLLIMLIAGGLFFGFVASWAWHNMSPAVPMTFAYLYFFSLSSFIKASTTNPGILPRHIHPAGIHGLIPQEYTMVTSLPGYPSGSDNTAQVKYCATCGIWRTPRISHCATCDNCVELHDHHCIWLNNCIGRRNYRYFICFLTSTSLLTLYMTGICIYYIVQSWKNTNGSFAASLRSTPVGILLAIVGFFGSLYPLLVTFAHLYFMSTGQSTHEVLRYKGVKKHPFSTGNLFKNLFEILFRPDIPNYIQPRKPYISGDRRFENAPPAIYEE